MIFQFEAGERAHERNVAREECPHEEASREGAEWLAGWDAAEDSANHYAEAMIRHDQIERLEGRK